MRQVLIISLILVALNGCATLSGTPQQRLYAAYTLYAEVAESEGVIPETHKSVMKYYDLAREDTRFIEPAILYTLNAVVQIKERSVEQQHGTLHSEDSGDGELGGDAVSGGER